MRVNDLHSSMLISPSRSIQGKVEHYSGSTLLNTFKHTDALSSFTITRTAAKKFFGFGVSQEVELKLVDKDRQISINKGEILKISFAVSGNYTSPYPLFVVSEVTRDENTNGLTIKAADAIVTKADKINIAQMTYKPPFNLRVLAGQCAGLMGLDRIIIDNETDKRFREVLQVLNVAGTETLRAVLDDIAEATQTIYYQENDDIVFKALDIAGEPALAITKADYFTLSAKTPCILNGLAAVTELGDNIISTSGSTEYTQYIRDNIVWSTHTDIGASLDSALALVQGTTITPFNCKWRGNYLLEIGDKITVTTKDNDVISTYVLNEQTQYNGGLVSTLSWEYDNSEKDTAANPSTLGEALNQVYAKVDKVNKTIALVVQEEVREALKNGSFDGDIKELIDEKISQIQIDVDSIKASVMESTQDIIDSELVDIKEQVSMNMTKDEVEILIENSKTTGTEKVETTTGYTFNQDGLNISKKGSDMSTTITDDGITVYRDNDPVLIANNEGVKAEDLHATTYLIIGVNSRFEDYDNGQRTGCFWIGD